MLRLISMNTERGVSIIIPFRNQINLLNDCLRTLVDALGPEIDDVELILVDNRSDATELARVEIPKGFRHRIVRADIDFNFQKVVNLGAKEATGRYLLLLNNDILFD